MKKLFVTVLAIVMTMSVLLFTGCSGDLEPTEPAVFYLVTVNGGTGSGNYYEDALVKIEPETPSGKQFMFWESDGELVSSGAEYGFYVNKDTTLTAVYKDSVEGLGSRALTVSLTGVVDKNGNYMETLADGEANAFGEGGYLTGSEVTVATLSSVDGGKEFLGWVEVDENGSTSAVLSTEKIYSFDIDSNITLAPKYNVEFERTVTAGPRTIVRNGNESVSFDQNWYLAHETLEDAGKVFANTGAPTFAEITTAYNSKGTDEDTWNYFTPYAQLMRPQTNSNWWSPPLATPEYYQYYTPTDTTGLGSVGANNKPMYDRISMLLEATPLYTASGWSRYAKRDGIAGIKYNIYEYIDSAEPVGVMYASSIGTGLCMYSDINVMHASFLAQTNATALLTCQWPNSGNHLLDNEGELNMSFGVCIPGYTYGNLTDYYVSSQLIMTEDYNANGTYYLPSLENERVRITI